jgi:hypothetical protein
MPFDGKPEQYTESQVKQDLRATLAAFGLYGENHFYSLGDDGRELGKDGVMCLAMAMNKATGGDRLRMDATDWAIRNQSGGMIVMFSDNNPFPVVRDAIERAIALA